MTKAFNKTVFGTLFFSLFTVITGVGIVVPLLPVYAHHLGARGLYIAMIFGAFSLSRSFFLPYFGRKSDQKGRKPFIVFGLMAYALISVAFVFSQTVETLIAIRFCQGIASAMIMPVVNAYIGDITPPGQEGFIMGIFHVSLFMGLSIGPLAGGAINDHLGLDYAFFCMGALATISFILSFIFLPPTKTENICSRGISPLPWRQLITEKDIAGLFVFRFTYTACIGIIWGFLPVYADSRFALTSTQIGVLVMLGVFISGLFQVPMGYMADRTNKYRMITIGGFIVGIAVLSFEWADGFWHLFAANIAFGFGGGMSMASHMALAVQKGQKTGAMGAVMGLLTMAHSVGMLFGALFAGLMMEMVQLQDAFSYGAFMMFLGLLAFMVFTSSSSANWNAN